MDVSQLRCFSSSDGLIISAMIMFLVVVVDIPHHYGMVVIGVMSMFFVGPYNCSVESARLKLRAMGKSGN